MDEARMWAGVEQGRLRLADFLEGLSEQDWERPSLCDGWRIRDVAAHLAGNAQFGTKDWLREAVRARGSFDRMVRESARRLAAAPPGEIVAQLRTFAGSRRVPPAPGAGADSTIMDVLTHTLDIGLVLGHEPEIPPEDAVAGLGSLWKLRFPFNPRKHLKGLRLVAEDADWAVGSGPEVRGPAASFLLLLTNRPAAYDRLEGPGLASARVRLG
ncbi:maleylpyruvate isomerase family mycothiol-dependent enzyme [Amycolatopsis tolypomycina]|uniref:TIGR03083 family protein n=1 Tax=Amycolatopsis tolypomycina TaxID=208445 RepID=A0A1H4WG92_9PSEU|nr:maleylpyruvate isomerase family mycothiol-dependent enzyme [Amycolatopsis tolypomycina]SEC91758.1 TIGR03083 family protein [Amycolatopsis tolypomycina]